VTRRLRRDRICASGRARGQGRNQAPNWAQNAVAPIPGSSRPRVCMRPIESACSLPTAHWSERPDRRGSGQTARGIAPRARRHSDGRPAYGQRSRRR
jgi:hypothetical protein